MTGLGKMARCPREMREETWVSRRCAQTGPCEALKRYFAERSIQVNQTESNLRRGDVRPKIDSPVAKEAGGRRPSQTRSNQTKSNQIKPNQTCGAVGVYRNWTIRWGKVGVRQPGQTQSNPIKPDQTPSQIGSNPVKPEKKT
jgi:hypothetical protein